MRKYGLYNRCYFLGLCLWFVFNFIEMLIDFKLTNLISFLSCFLFLYFAIIWLKDDLKQYYRNLETRLEIYCRLIDVISIKLHRNKWKIYIMGDSHENHQP